MNYFWGNVFEYCKERRNVALFFATLMVFLGLLVASAIIYQVADIYDLFKYWPFMAIVLCVFVLAFIGKSIRQARERRLNRYKSSPLSRDELVKARSKLRRTKK